MLVDGEKAYVLTQLIGPVAVGDRVVMNTTAVELGLGTGGWHVVHWNLSREEWSEPGLGHIMKLRYTSLQAETPAAGADTARRPNAPVVVCGLHSHVACVAVTLKALSPKRTLTYVMTDGAALPLALSDLVHDLRAAGLLDATITCGHAFGGDVEAVGIRDALALVDTDAAIVSMGPGVVGTGTTLGTTAMETADVVGAAARLGMRPIWCVRYSAADRRARHNGWSHHTVSAIAEGASTVPVPIPRGEPEPAIDANLVEVEVPDVPRLLAEQGLRVTSMGREPEEDPKFYAYAGAAGVYASRLLRG